MWTFPFHTLDAQTKKGMIYEGSRALSFAEILRLWENEEGFVRSFSDALAALPFEAYFWETPPIAHGRDARAFEFVATSAPALAKVKPDPAPFRAQFAGQPKTQVLTFANLGGDAVLIVPAPVAKTECYTHLAQFVREAPDTQRLAFWKAVGAGMSRRLAEVAPAPVWLSTAGMGVSWLHLRMDARPKYYRHRAYTVYDP